MERASWPGIVRAYSEYLPLPPGAEPVTLLEGGTPLVPAPRISDLAGPGVQVFLKFDGANPTGSFKDRGMAYAMSHAAASGSRAVVCASTGNTSASAAAFAARAGLRAYVVIPEGKIALGKLAQAMMHGATVMQVQGNFDRCLEIVRRISEERPITLVNSVNPFRIEGQKTAAFEVIDVLGDAPNYHFLPVGNAGNITAYWLGYNEYRTAKKSTRRPKMMGFQAAGSAPIVDGHPIEHPNTIATAIRIGNPAKWKEALAARDESGGAIDKVTDDEILGAYQQLAQLEGVFCEPASAASVAGLLKMAKQKTFRGGDQIVCTLTGHGLKDPDTALKVLPAPKAIPADYKAVIGAMGL